MFSERAMEKEIRDIFFTIMAQNTHGVMGTQGCPKSKPTVEIEFLCKLEIETMMKLY